MSFSEGSGETQAGVTVGRGGSAVGVGGSIVGGTLLGSGVEVGGGATGIPQDETSTAKARNINILFIMFTRPYRKVVIREYSM
jgi:hypothetical protein